jgi:release factor glutamine methyltransferase
LVIHLGGWVLGKGPFIVFFSLNLAEGSYSVRVTVLEIIQRSTEFLSKKGVDSARLQSELLLADVLKLRRMQLYLNFERVVTKLEEDALRERILRRSKHEPLQHILGTACFCGLDMAVNAHTLVPRPETELLAEKAWEFLGQRPAAGGKLAPSALDFGTGSGCLAILLAVKCSSATLVACDISSDALSMARANAARHGVSERVQFLLGDGFLALEGKSQFDLIVSNPPYIPTGEIDGLEPEVRDHDPRAALDGGADGLDFYRRLAGEALGWIKPGGKLMAEFGDDQAEKVRAIFEKQNWVVEQVVEDYTHRPRHIIAHG